MNWIVCCTRKPPPPQSSSRPFLCQSSSGLYRLKSLLQNFIHWYRLNGRKNAHKGTMYVGQMSVRFIAGGSLAPAESQAWSNSRQPMPPSCDIDFTSRIGYSVADQTIEARIVSESDTIGSCRLICIWLPRQPRLVAIALICN
jgi:hypothetical protein